MKYELLTIYFFELIFSNIQNVYQMTDKQFPLHMMLDGQMFFDQVQFIFVLICFAF